MNHNFSIKCCSFNTSTEKDWNQMIQLCNNESKRQCDRSAMGKNVINHLHQKQNVSVWMLQECGSVLQSDQWFKDFYQRISQVRSSSRDFDCDVAIVWNKDEFSEIDFPIVSNPNSDGYRCISMVLKHCESKVQIIFSSLLFEEFRCDPFDFESSMKQIKRANDAKLHLEFIHNQYPNHPHVVGCDLNGDRMLNDVVPKILCQASNRSMIECIQAPIFGTKLHTRMRFDDVIPTFSNDDTIFIKRHPQLIKNDSFIFQNPFKLLDTTYPSDHLPLVREFIIFPSDPSTNDRKGCPIDVQSFCPLC